MTSALKVNVRQIQNTKRPSSGLLASADVNPRTVLISSRLQCVPFARERSGVAIRGNANTWWKQASGSFVRVKMPAVGSVVVMQTRRGHVGVVTKIVDKRTVIIDHANWLSNGQIYLDQPMMDVSPNNDWSKVVVWHPTLGQFGKRALGVSGFIVDAPARGNSTVYASLADVPANLASGVQYASLTTPAAPAVAAPAPVVVASAVPQNYDASPQPLTKPDNVTPLAGRPEVSVPAAPVAVAAAAPIYVDTIVPLSKPATVGGTTAAPVAIAAATPAPAAAAAAPVYVDTITPRAKPDLGGSAAPAAVALATQPSGSVEVASATYVDTIVPNAKPAKLGTAVATAEVIPASGDATYIPTMKPAAVVGGGATIATFR